MNNRCSQFELLRIIAMFGILLWHAKLHFMGDIYTRNVYLSLAMPVISIHVNLFILISGYFGINLKLKTLYTLWSAILFYTGINVLVNYLCNSQVLSADSLVASFLFPLSACDWWFIRLYVILIFLAPIINFVFEQVKSEKQLYSVTILILILDVYFSFIHKSVELSIPGYNLIHMLCMYTIGRLLYYKKFDIKRGKLLKMISLIILSKMTLVGIGFIFPTFRDMIDLNGYSNPINIVYSVIVFLFVASFNFYNKYINYIASSALAVYLLTDHIVIRSLLRSLVNSYYCYIESYNALVIFVMVIAVTSLLFITSIYIDKFRLWAFSILNNFVYKRIENSKFNKSFKI